MNLCKTEHPLEQCLQEVEQVLERYGCVLSVSFGGGLQIESGRGGVRGELKDIDNRDTSTALPRSVESERLVLIN